MPSTQISLVVSWPGLAYMCAIPLSFLVYLALRFKEVLAGALAVIQVTEEKRELLASQNQVLEHQVEARTAELKASTVGRRSWAIRRDKLRYRIHNVAKFR